MKLIELLMSVPIETNIVIIKSNKYYSNTEYYDEDETQAELFDRNDFISNFGGYELKEVSPKIFGYDDCILSIKI
jgi:hypothetical protein